MKKFLLSLSILLIGITNFSFGADSYTCSYQGIINEVAKNGSLTTYNLTNCNDLGGYYDCSVFADISTSNGYCYQIGGFDLNYFADININIDFGGSYISFGNSYNNLDQLNGYTVCNPSRLMIQGRANAYVSNLPFTITTFSESALTHYSYTYTCPTCDTSSLENQLNSCKSDLATATGNLATCQSDLATCQNSSSNCDYSEYENTINTLSGNLATCEGMYDRLESDYDLLSGNYSTCVSDLNSCMNNSSCEGDIQWSSLFINDQQFLGNKNVFINIPFEYQYSYTNTGEDFELSVVGLNQDTEYLSGIINKQNYIPTTEDLSNVMSNFGLFGGLLVVCLFVILVFYMIKKIFK